MTSGVTTFLIQVMPKKRQPNFTQHCVERTPARETLFSPSNKKCYIIVISPSMLRCVSYWMRRMYISHVAEMLFRHYF